MKLDVIAVVYNKRYADTVTYKRVSMSEMVNRFIVCDNSTDPSIQEDNSRSIPMGAMYLPMGGNVGLSKAYNHALDRASSQFIMLLDDDTFLPDGFFGKLEKHLTSDEADIYLPLVYSSEFLMSPCKKNGYRFKRITNYDGFHGKISAINSGVVAKRSVFDYVKYDESLFVDMVDHKFFDDVRESGMKVHIMGDVVLKQDYSRETDDYDAAKTRFLISKKDNRAYFASTLLGSIFCEMQLVYWRIKKCIKFKRLDPMGW